MFVINYLAELYYYCVCVFHIFLSCQTSGPSHRIGSTRDSEQTRSKNKLVVTQTSLCVEKLQMVTEKKKHIFSNF